MGVTDSKETANANATTTTASTGVSANKRLVLCTAENNLIIWVDARTDEKNPRCQKTLAALRRAVNFVNICLTKEACIEALNKHSGVTTFLIVSGTIGQTLVPEIHNRPQLEAIYVFCTQLEWHKAWAKEWFKIKGVYNSILPICDALPLAVKQSNEAKLSISTIRADDQDSDENINQLPPVFMYSQIFKEALLEISYEKEAINELVNFSRDIYDGNESEIEIINQLENSYKPSKAIWWYTRECFVYRLLNGALRTLDGDVLIKMGFFLRDLHRQIEKLHKVQSMDRYREQFIVYRGQMLLNEDFKNLKKSKGGLISFNSFLSTSTNRDEAIRFAKPALERSNMVGIFFQMTIDPTVSSSPFAAIKEYSDYKKEDEILFSMHTVFRIRKIKELPDTPGIYQVDLRLTSDDDKQLNEIAEHIRKKTEGSVGWARLAKLLYKIGQFREAGELYRMQLDHATSDSEKAELYIQLGIMKKNQGLYKEAILYFEKALRIYNRTLTQDHPDFAAVYCQMGLVYNDMHEYSNALEYYEKALKINTEILPPNHINLADLYNNIGLAYNNMRKYSKALEFYEKAHQIKKKILRPYDPELAISYNNIGHTYKNLNNYSTALDFYVKAHKIKEKALPPTHPELGISYNNMAWAYQEMGDNTTGLKYLQNAYAIWQKTLPSTHPHIKQVTTNIEHLRKKLNTN